MTCDHDAHHAHHAHHGGASRASAQAHREPAADQVLHGWRRALAFPLELFILAYRMLISPLIGDVCRFYPTCSSYGLTSVRRFGLFRGAWLIVRRLVRCHPWNPGGVDHVPLRDTCGRPMGHNEASPAA
jgi:putative membrane protein insertion efficiency factor